MNNTSWRISAQQKMELHLELLYNSELALEIFSTKYRNSRDSSWLKTIDLNRLSVEQDYRLRALLSQIRASCEPLWDVVDESELYVIMKKYTKSPKFWSNPGRSLAEGFCLCAKTYFLESGRSHFGALAQLLGIASGLPAYLGQKSPWEGSMPVPDLGIPGVVGSEGFMSNFSLIDITGQPCLGNELEASAFTFVLCFEDRSMLLGCLDHHNV